MTAGIWLLFYDIGAADRDHYVDWFHRRHIPEKLARPGYRWAAHFEAPAGPDNTDLYHYIGMFGGDSTKVFLDPSPAQLKLTQSDETRAMMARRQNPSSAILAHEWSWFSPADAHAGTATDMPRAGINAPHIQILTIEGPAHDEMIGSACAQKLAPGFVRHEKAIACHKMTNVMGGPRHMMLFAQNDISPAGRGCGPLDLPLAPDDLSVLTDLGDAVKMTTRWGRRIWPA